MPRTVDLATVQTDLIAWLAARRAAATGATFSIGGRTLSRYDLDTINSTIASLQRQEAALLDEAAGITPSAVRFSVANVNP